MEWNQRYAEGDTPWDKGEVAPPLRAYFDKSAVDVGQHLLVPGCGRGHDTHYLASLGHEVRGIDLATRAIEEARRRATYSGEHYEIQDFFELPDAYYEAFSAVVEHTFFCAIEPHRREDYVKQAAWCLKAQGLLLGVFFTAFDKKNDAEPEGPPYASSQEELEKLFSTAFEIVDRQPAHEQFPDRLDATEEIWLFQKRSP